MTTQARYFVQQKASNEQYRRAVRAFARDLTPQQARVCAEITHRPDLSENSLYRFYALLRQRLCAVTYFLPVPVSGYGNSTSNHLPPLGLSESDYLRSADRLIGHRRGVSGKSRSQHRAELMHRLRTDQTEQDLIYDIETIIKITGPLNRAPVQIKKAHDFISARLYMRQLRTLRRMPKLDPEHERRHQEIIDLYLKVISVQ